MAIDSWTDEECRYFFHLFSAEKTKGNKTKSGLNQTGKDFIMKKFEERFGKALLWDKFKNKYDSCRRSYAKFKKLTHNRTGLGYDALGRLDMPDHWWEERIQEWPDARKYRNKPIPNMDIFEEEFGAIIVTGAEGWSAQHGEASLDCRLDGDEDEVNSLDTELPETQTQDVETRSQSGNARPKRRRREKDIVIETAVTRNAVLAQKNKIQEKMLENCEREYACSVERVLEVLNELPGVRKWSLFHRAAVDHLLASEANRRGFIAFASVEDKISYLEHRTGTNLDA